MNIFQHRVVRACSAAAIVAGGVGAAAAPASASETWRFERTRAGGYAQSCGRFGGDRVCATVYCGRGVRGMEVGLTGWDPRGRGDLRQGRIEIDGRGRDARYLHDSEPVVGDVWRADLGRGSDRVIDRIKAGRSLSMDIAARGSAYRFTLNGSSDAITRLERRCAQRTAADGGSAIRIGNDNIGLTIRLGDRNHGDRHVGRANFGPGWDRVATNRVDHRRDRDVIQLGRNDGRFDALRLRALDNDVRVRRVLVRYGNGVQHEVNVDHRLNAGEASDVIDLRGRKGRVIDRITLVYDTQGRGPRARVEVWGHESRDRANAGGFGPNWERIAVNRVDRRRDRDVINVGRDDGRFDAIRLRALRNDVRVRRVMVRYGNGVEHEVDVNRRLNAGDASNVIDLRGRNGRVINRITLVYDTQGRGPEARVEVWGRQTRS